MKSYLRVRNLATLHNLQDWRDLDRTLVLNIANMIRNKASVSLVIIHVEMQEPNSDQGTKQYLSMGY